MLQNLPELFTFIITQGNKIFFFNLVNSNINLILTHQFLNIKYIKSFIITLINDKLLLSYSRLNCNPKINQLIRMNMTNIGIDI